MDWLLIAGLAVAITIGVVALLASYRRSRRRLASHLPVLAAIDPHVLGVSVAAPGRSADNGGLPAYIPRDVDGELRAAIRDGISKPNVSVILVVGNAAAGKTRTLYEAALATAPDAS